jgi:hypothetical protein
VVAPHPEQKCRASCLGVVQPSSRCHLVHNCFPSLVHSPLRMRSENVSNCLSHVWVAVHSMVRCRLRPRQTAQQGNGPVAVKGRTVRTFLLPAWLPVCVSSAGVKGRLSDEADCWVWLDRYAAATCCGVMKKRNDSDFRFGKMRRGGHGNGVRHRD